MHRHKVTGITVIGEYLLRHEVCPARYLEKLGLPPAVLLGSELWLDRDTCFRIGENLGLVTGDPVPGLHVAELQDLRAYGRWSDGILASPNLGTALRFAAGNIRLIETGRLMELAFDGDRVRLRMPFFGNMEIEPREYSDASLLLLSRFIRLAGEDVPIEVHLPHKRPADTTELERLLGPDLVFEAREAALVLDRDALSLPLDSRRVEAEAPHRADPAQMHAIVTATVARTVEKIMVHERPTAVGVAAALSMNVRTMQRHLAAWGVTFERLLEDFRLHHAIIALREEHQLVTDVAFQLGYSDAAHFTRAFRRWTGLAPSKAVTAREQPRGIILPVLAGSSTVAG